MSVETACGRLQADARQRGRMKPRAFCYRSRRPVHSRLLRPCPSTPTPMTLGPVEASLAHSTSAAPADFHFYLSCDLNTQVERMQRRCARPGTAITRCRRHRRRLLLTAVHSPPPTSLLQVQVRVDRLLGCLPSYREAEAAWLGVPLRPSALCVEGRLHSYGEPLGIPARTPWAVAGGGGADWDAWLAFPLKYRDLGHDAQLALTVWEARDGAARRALGGTTLRLFSKKGRLKTGTQDVQLWPGREADGGWPSATPGKVPVAQRGELG